VEGHLHEGVLLVVRRGVVDVELQHHLVLGEGERGGWGEGVGEVVVGDGWGQVVGGRQPLESGVCAGSGGCASGRK